MNQEYETVIGLEVHVELATQTKIFCGCSTAFGASPNTHTCPVCTGMPGSLPVLNRQVVEYTIAVGLATHCTIAEYCRFDRKNYFYPDNPQNYQISQLYLPICRDGYVEIRTGDKDRKIGIHEIHMEEDAGKLIHDEEGENTWIDYNRSGIPLIEIVSEPDMRSSQEVIAYLEQLKLMIQYLGASDCKLNEGSMRVDVNLSVRKKGAAEYGTRTEMKNLNSFKAIARVITHESRRQIELLEQGETVVQETRRWEDDKECSYPMRSKEDARDYRYFPEPDLAPVVIDEEWIQRVEGSQPEMPAARRKRYQEEYGLPAYDAEILTASRKMADIFEETTALRANPKTVSNYLMGETMRLLKECGMDAQELAFSPANLAALIELTEEGVINRTVAKEVFGKIFSEDIEPRAYVEEHGLKMDNNKDGLERLLREIIENHPQSVQDYHNGKEKALGYLVGQAMKATQGKANPEIIHKILREIL